ncbi:hypothetical protein MB818_10300 [Ruegeria sp. 1NDH52C]|uniref:Uncharacterized protein n=1 Tax=Ruegeria alba TaxID=2916756 RepID=A0ABS9NWK3_9RHOB|nr:hypothetical protein [Ruegeria alba]MCG6558593.1 hypothetical protein [Ruegeria alba]
MVDTQLAVVTQKVGQADLFVPDSRDQENIAWSNCSGIVLNGAQFPRFADATQKTALAPHSHPIGVPKAHAAIHSSYDASMPGTYNQQTLLVLTVYVTETSMEATGLESVTSILMP